jgi:hypothetical protein
MLADGLNLKLQEPINSLLAYPRMPLSRGVEVRRQQQQQHDAEPLLSQ